jgi:sirohydrochlorin ferrochelatase
LPRIVADLALQHPGIEMRITPPLEGHPALVQILLDRVKEYLTITH